MRRLVFPNLFFLGGTPKNFFCILRSPSPLEIHIGHEHLIVGNKIKLLLNNYKNIFIKGLRINKVTL